MAHMFFTALLAWLTLLALAANPTTWASSADAASRPYDVNVKGAPEFVDEHSQLMLPGKYLATLFLELTQQQVSNTARVGALPRVSVTALRRVFNIWVVACFSRFTCESEGVACCSRSFGFSVWVLVCERRLLVEDKYASMRPAYSRDRRN